MPKVLNYTHEYLVWDVKFTVPTFDFIFKFPIPGPNKERVITKRDGLGRIIHSTPLVIAKSVLAR